jgi:hypothetical protein
MVLADTTTAVASAASADFAPADPSPVETGVPPPPPPPPPTRGGVGGPPTGNW